MSDTATSTVRALPSSQGGYDRVPPHDLDAETSVIGAMLLSKDAIAEVSEVVGPEDFYRGAHRTMFEAIHELYDRGEPVDAITLADELKRRGQLDDVGGTTGIADVVNRVPTAANALYYAKIVAQQALRRRLIEAGTEITKLGYADVEDVQHSVDAAESLVYRLSQYGRVSEFTPMKQLIAQGFELIERLHENNSPITGLATGFTDFDELTAGLQPSNLVIIAGRPSMGKSTLAVNMGTNIAVEQRRPVVLFSLEMSQMELVQRILAAEARVDSERLRTGRLKETDWPKLSRAMGKLAEAPFFIDDTPGITLMEIRSKARRLKQQHGLDLLMVDYLQLMQAHRRHESRVQEVSELSRGLKILAKELDIPVIALSQLSRRPEDRTDRRPQLADLRESGCLTADTRILRADTGAEITMGELYANGECNIPVWTVDDRYRMVRGTMTHVFSNGHKPVFRMRLASGRAIKATANHPFLTLEGWARLDKLDVGSRIAVPRTIPEPESADVWLEEHVVLLAHLIGDGCVVERQLIHYTSADEANIEVVEAAARSAFGITARRVRQANRWHAYLPAPHQLTRGRRDPIAAWLAELGLHGKRSYEKFIPTAVFKLKLPQVRLFLRHLWATDGHISCRDRTVFLYYATSSQGLAHDLQLLLLRAGIHSRIRRVGKQGYRDVHQVWIYGRDSQSRFLRGIGVHGARGAKVADCQSALDLVREAPKLDTIPPGIWELIRRRRLSVGMSIDRLASASGVPRVCGSGSPHAPSRAYVAAIADTLEDENLQALANSELYWDRVVEIEYLRWEEVFDATVLETHNFVANNIVLSNSIEQDADIVCFIYRDEVYNPETTSKGEAELIVAKHRNGPLRTVPLAFLGATSRFASLRRAAPAGAPSIGPGGPPTQPPDPAAPL